MRGLAKEPSREESSISQDRIAIRDWPSADKPRERLFHSGPEALSDAELLAIILGTGNTQESAVELSRRMLKMSEDRYGSSLGFLHGAALEELRELSGVGPAKAARIKAGVELGRRLYGAGVTPGNRRTLRGSRDYYECFRMDLADLDRESFMVLSLNARRQAIAKEVVSVGSLDTALVHPREIFRSSIRRNAAYIVMAHNHPSGDPTPSDEDIRITKLLVDSGVLLGIPVIDHIVVAKSSYTSMKESFPGCWAL